MQGYTPVKDRIPYVKALIYGKAGAGKTRFAADAPKPVYFDFESSTETLRYWPEYSETPVKKPKEIQECRRDILKAITDPEIETVIIDSITTALDFYMRAEAAKRATKRDPFEFWEQDYKYATQVFSDLFGFLADAPINVVVIGHRKVVYDKDTGDISGIFPDITPRLRENLTRLVNVVGYMEAKASEAKGSTTRKLYINATNTIEAKNRLNIQETFVVNPTWKELFNA